jgi:hypothetical protein
MRLMLAVLMVVGLSGCIDGGLLHDMFWPHFNPLATEAPSVLMSMDATAER